MRKSYTKDNLDRFYTSSNVVEKLLSEINLEQYALIIEPSAGNGAFSSQIPNCLAFDISPAHPSVIQQDFLLWQYDGNVPRNRILCIGNPPFGRQSSLAIKFIKKCAEFADTIAFILPLSFKKESVQARVPAMYHLIKQIELGENSFLLDGQPYDVPCIFQIWQNKYTIRMSTPKVEPIGFKYVKCNEQPDFAIRRVGVYAGKAYLECAEKAVQSHYFIQLESADRETIAGRINLHFWQHENTVGPRSISKQELNVVLNEIIKQQS